MENYRGSRLLEGLSNYASLNLDQLNFVVSHLIALALAGFYRTVLGPTKVSSNVRHVFGLLFGIWIAYFCFGYQALHIAGLPAICYLIMLTNSPSVVHTAVLFAAMLYLSLIHLHRQFYENSTFGLDISGPLMVVTQKVTSVAFNLHDGFNKNDENMTNTQKHYALKNVPGMLEYFSYNLTFPSIMVGPMIFYKDYIDFIEGHTIIMSSKDTSSSSKSVVVRAPSPVIAVLQKLTVALICALVFVLFLPKFPISLLKEEEFILGTSLSYKISYLIIVTTLMRTKFYFAWTLADAISNNAGLGWDGTNWNRFSNVDIYNFEFSLSLKESIDSWNKGTNRWLRFIVYKRVKKYSTLVTFTLSAVWHGFYPGYYITFLCGALFTFASRIMRRHIRPYFMSSTESKIMYDLFTFTITRITIAYITFPFILLEFWGSMVVYDKLYWVMHVLACLTIWAVPQLIPKPEPGELTEKSGSIAIALSKAGPYSDAVGKID